MKNLHMILLYCLHRKEDDSRTIISTSEHNFHENQWSLRKIRLRIQSIGEHFM